MKNFLSLQFIEPDSIKKIVLLAKKFKKERGKVISNILNGETWGLFFLKASTRTRLSFEVGITELGGSVVFLSPRDMQIDRGELLEDTAEIFARMLHGIVVRTFSQSDLELIARISNIPTINALTNEEHPCQILSDILTIQELLPDKKEWKMTFIGDANCNVVKSWIWASVHLDIPLTLVAPENYNPNNDLLNSLDKNKITLVADPREGIKEADIIYTDVWVSMGQELEKEQRIHDLMPYQVNKELLSFAKPSVHVLHCLPAYRGQEITSEVFNCHRQSIFQQAENRLHTQKGIIAFLKS